ncbi:MAG: hypothetical protein SGJ00_03620 [bacterium]|nr:hypothetical protein [bacterium]
MKQLKFLAFVFVLALAACQPDATDEPTPDQTEAIDFVGTWNRDSVLLNDVYPSKLKVRVETEANFGVYILNADLQTGIMNLSGSDFAITWKYTSSTKSILISELDWMGQTYLVQTVSKNKLILTGYKDTGDGNQVERILYLTRK